jgi:hypothetical protein
LIVPCKYKRGKKKLLEFFLLFFSFVFKEMLWVANLIGGSVLVLTYFTLLFKQKFDMSNALHNFKIELPYLLVLGLLYHTAFHSDPHNYALLFAALIQFGTHLTFIFTTSRALHNHPQIDLIAAVFGYIELISASTYLFIHKQYFLCALCLFVGSVAYAGHLTDFKLLKICLLVIGASVNIMIRAF